jgi:hypothetical protein
VAYCSSASERVLALIPYMGGELHSFLCAVGGCRIDVALGNADLEGGE